VEGAENNQGLISNTGKGIIKNVKRVKTYPVPPVPQSSWSTLGPGKSPRCCSRAIHTELHHPSPELSRVVSRLAIVDQYHDAPKKARSEIGMRVERRRKLEFL
jgi:hypothetical protein